MNIKKINFADDYNHIYDKNVFKKIIENKNYRFENITIQDYWTITKNIIYERYTKEFAGKIIASVKIFTNNFKRISRLLHFREEPIDIKEIFKELEHNKELFIYYQNYANLLSTVKLPTLSFIEIIIALLLLILYPLFILFNYLIIKSYEEKFLLEGLYRREYKRYIYAGPFGFLYLIKLIGYFK